MALDIERMMEKVLQIAEQKQKALGINSYWGGTTSNASRAHDDAQTRAKWDAIDRKDALRDKISSDEKMTAEKTTADQYRSALKSQQDQYNTDAKNRNAIEVANIRAGGTSRKDPSTLSAHERTQAAIEVMRQNPGLPGKPGMDLTTAAKEVDKMHSQGQTKLNPDGTVAPAGVGISEQRQELVPGHKNAPLAERTGITVPAGQLTRPIDTPMGAAPSALSANQWQQYADSKSPGMKYEGNQPGMVGDQIARFKRPDGSAFFANTGAAQMQMGNALTPAPSSPLVNTPGAEPRATMPDASNRSAMNTKALTPVNKGKIDSLAGVGQKAINTVDLADKGIASAGRGIASAADYLGESTSSALDNFTSSLPKGFGSWLKSWNKRKTSTNPLFPNYAQE